MEPAAMLLPYSYTRPYNSVICAETAHIYVDECGAPARMTGCQIRPVTTPDGKLTPELVRPYLCHFGEQHHSQPGLFISLQCTELGTVYRPDEIRALTELAHRHGMYRPYGRRPSGKCLCGP